MSLIERALGRAKVDAGAAASLARRRINHRAAEQNNIKPRAFKRLTLDPAILEPHRVLLYSTNDVAIRAYKVARTRLLKRLAANKWQSVAITSSSPGDGKSVTAINLAMALAQDSSTHVFLVDLDLQRPTTARYLGLPRMPGISDYLAGEAKLDDIIYDIGETRLAVIPNFESLHESSELLRGPRMDELASALAAEVPRRIIVYDMPPVLVGDDVMSFSETADAVVLVVAEGVTSRAALENAKNVLAEMNLVGVVLNNATQSKDENYAYY